MKNIKTLTISATLGDTWQEGAKLNKPAQIAAYLRDVWRSLNHEEELSTDEIMKAYNFVANSFDATAVTSDEVEGDVMDWLESYTSGQQSGEDEETTLGSVSAENRRAVAYTAGTKLSDTGFDAHVAVILAARLELKRGAIMVLDDLIGRQAFTGKTSHVYVNSIGDNQQIPSAYSMADLLAWPRPGSKAPKGTEVSDADAMRFDIYKASISGETVRSSWYKDMILATVEAATLAKRVDELAEKAKDDGHIKSDRKTDESQLNSAVNVLRDAVLSGLALHSLARFPLLRIEIQREDDGTPLKTQYPVIVYQEGKRGSMMPITLGQLKHMTDPSEGNAKLSRLDLALAAGGTIDNLKTFGMPKKKKGPGKNAIKVADAEAVSNALFAVSTYLQSAGAQPLLSKLTGPKNNVSEAYLHAFAITMQTLLPIWDQTEVQERVADIQRKQSAKKNAA